MGKFIFITGGARSGKSSLALKLAEESGKDKLFVATCVVEDEEMAERVRRHQVERSSEWRTVEAGTRLVEVLMDEVAHDAVMVVDCLTLFVSSLLLRGDDEGAIKQNVTEFVDVVRKGTAEVVLVSNEVGAGIVPENKLARDFRDIAGICNQIVAASADDVYWMVSGIPVQIKGGK